MENKMTRYTKTFAEAMQEVREGYSDKQIKMAYGILNDPRYKGGNYSGAVSAIEKLAKGLSKHPDVANALKRANESVNEDYEVSMAIGQLRTINEYASKLISILESKGADYNIEAWIQSKITTAEDYMNSVGHYMENNPDVANEAKEEPKEKDLDKIALAKEKDTDSLEKTILQMQGKMNLLQQKLENEKNKIVKPQPNSETGEVPLRTGLANAILDKKIDTKDLMKSKKKEEIKVGGKTKIEINPDKNIGNFSGGMNVNNGNLH